MSFLASHGSVVAVFLIQATHKTNELRVRPVHLEVEDGDLVADW